MVKPMIEGTTGRGLRRSVCKPATAVSDIPHCPAPTHPKRVGADRYRSNSFAARRPLPADWRHHDDGGAAGRRARAYPRTGAFTRRARDRGCGAMARPLTRQGGHSRRHTADQSRWSNSDRRASVRNAASTELRASTPTCVALRSKVWIQAARVSSK